MWSVFRGFEEQNHTTEGKRDGAREDPAVWGHPEGKGQTHEDLSFEGLQDTQQGPKAVELILMIELMVGAY